MTTDTQLLAMLVAASTMDAREARRLDMVRTRANEVLALIEPLPQPKPSPAPAKKAARKKRGR